MISSSKRGYLGQRLVTATIAFSAAIIITFTGLRSWTNSRAAERNLDAALDQGIAAYADPIAEALWVFDAHLVSSQVQALVNLDLISYAAVSDDRGLVTEVGLIPSGRNRERRTRLEHLARGRIVDLGELRVVGDEIALHRAFVSSMLRDLPLFAVVVAFMATFILVFVDRGIGRRVVAAARHFESFDPRVPRIGLPTRTKGRHDEIDELIDEYNRLEGRFRDSWNEVEAARARAESSEAALQASLKEKDVLISELFHRTRNSLQIVLGLIRLAGDGAAGPELGAALAELEMRIQAMALVHRELQERRDLSRIRLDEFVREFAPYARRGVIDALKAAGIVLELDEIETSLDIATPFGIALGELLADLDYGRDARLRLSETEGGEVLVEVEGYAVRTSGSGLELARTLIVDQLQGTMELGSDGSGRWTARVSFANRRQGQRS